MGGSFGGMMARHATALGMGIGCTGTPTRPEKPPRKFKKLWKAAQDASEELSEIRYRYNQKTTSALLEFRSAMVAQKSLRRFRICTIRQCFDLCAKGEV